MFKKVLERITGKKIQRHSMSAAVTGRAWLSELRSLARRTKEATREPVTMEPGKKIDVFMTGDINPKTGKLYDNYLERRAAREKEERDNAPLWDVYPD